MSSEQPPKEYTIDADTLAAFGDYFLAAVRGDEDTTKLLSLWKTNLSVATSRPHPSPIDCSICPNPSLRNEQFRSKLENQRKIYEARIAEAARKAREEYAKKIYNMCECVPLKEYASDYDRGFHQAMTLVREWCTTPQSEHCALGDCEVADKSSKRCENCIRQKHEQGGSIQ